MLGKKSSKKSGKRKWKIYKKKLNEFFFVINLKLCLGISSRVVKGGTHSVKKDR